MYNPHLFPTTHWSVIDKAKGSDPTASEAAIDRLCAIYWSPIHNYICCLGQPAQDAQDLTQEFFKQQLVRRNLFLEAQKERGALRKYVSVAVKRLVFDSEKKKRRLKRGGDRTVLSLEETGDPSQALYENSATPEEVFDRQWATALLERSLTTLETEYNAKGKGQLFKALRPYLSSDQATESQEAVALRLGKKVGALRMDLNRLRTRFAEVYRLTVAETIPSRNSRVVDEEIAYLGSLFS